MPVFQEPPLAPRDRAVIDEIIAMRSALASDLRTPSRWSGGLRRTAEARAIQASNSIEGYTVDHADALAAVDNEPASNADLITWREIQGYRRVLTFVINVATQDGTPIDESTLRSMHFMLLEHDLAKSPGRYRTGPIYVSGADGVVYTAPDAEQVPSLMGELVTQLRTSRADLLVAAAMAHLNLVMIHPFRDGNGRMARALQTLVLGRDGALDPAFGSIEEWLGRNTPDYYAVLAATGAGGWNPQRSALLWVRFNLRAYHMQAQTITRRLAEASQQWAAIDQLVADRGLPERMAEGIFDAWLGYRVTRPIYAQRSGVDDRTASRDLARLSDEGILTAYGQTRGRFYLAGPQLREAREIPHRHRTPLTDPYPDLPTTIAAAARQATSPTADIPLPDDDAPQNEAVS